MKRPRDSVEQTRDTHLAWMRAILAMHATDHTNLARAARLDPSALSKFLSSASARTLSAASIDKIKAAYGVPGPEIFAAAGGRFPGMSEADPVDPGALPPRMRRLVEAFAGNSATISAWALTTAALEMEGYLPGDLVFLDTARDGPLVDGTVACLQSYDFDTSTTRTVWRVYRWGAFHSARVARRQDEPIPATGAAIKGIVIGAARIAVDIAGAA